MGLFVEAFEWCEDEHAVHIAMEYCDSGNLEALADDIRGHNKDQNDGGIVTQKLDDLLNIFTQMARGLAYMHSRGYVHGDFTPKVRCLVPFL
jgi:serine/threonine protein kinase